jgi:hypothetical protein
MADLHQKINQPFAAKKLHAPPDGSRPVVASTLARPLSDRLTGRALLLEPLPLP